MSVYGMGYRWNRSPRLPLSMRGIPKKRRSP